MGWNVVACGVLLLFLTVGAYAADIPGAKDPSFLKRYAGSQIVSYQSSPYDNYNIGAPNPKDPSTWTFSPVEGQVARIIYHVPAGHTVLEVLRNYERALGDAGLTRTAERPPFSDTVFTNSVYQQSWQPQTASTFLWMEPWTHHFQQMAYVTAKGVTGGQNVTVAVWVGGTDHAYDVDFGHGRIHVTADSPLVIVDTVTTKSVHINMVTAADMADALATKGSVEIYGILFDVDKTDIKPESTKTLDEVANLLKIDRSLKLEISGHTDNTGDEAHNLALSEGRAKAVVHALVNRYGIDPSRLQAKGYGDTKPVAPNDTEANRAKNRRVELKKL
jgi:outer membrane protein OmpA-like peptidoglycan-associated protein